MNEDKKHAKSLWMQTMRFVNYILSLLQSCSFSQLFTVNCCNSVHWASELNLTDTISDLWIKHSDFVNWVRFKRTIHSQFRHHHLSWALMILNYRWPWTASDFAFLAFKLIKLSAMQFKNPPFWVLSVNHSQREKKCLSLKNTLKNKVSVLTSIHRSFFIVKIMSFKHTQKRFQ